MYYVNSNLHPDVVEFYRPNRSKHARCHSHLHSFQPTHAQRFHGNVQQTSQAQGNVQHKGASFPPHAIHHTNVQNFIDGRPHQHTQVTQHHHINHRSSVSPAQNISGTCSNNINTLSSRGTCSNSVCLSSASGSRPNHKVGTSLRAVDLMSLLKEKIALLPGGRSRRGGPLLCFPSNSRADEIPLEDLYVLVKYLTYLPDEKVKKLGFVVIVDMRSGTTWHSVKPILKVVEECLGGNVALTFIIKPDKLFEKHKAQMAIGKFSFEIQMVSVETLFREVDPSQLTAELEGSLPYHHEEWIEIRCCLEEFFLLAHDMSDKFGQLYCFLDRKTNPETVDEAKRILEEHRSVRLKIVQAPVSQLEAEADRLISCLTYGIAASQFSANNSASTQSNNTVVSSSTAGTGQGSSGGGAAFLATSWVSMNPDFKQLIPQVHQTMSHLYEFRARLQQKWETGRSRLEQIYQLRLFDDDVGRMSNWLDQQRHLFLTEYLDIGHTASHAADLHAEHRQFLTNCTHVREQVARLTVVAGMLADTGHFASQQILKQANQLEHEWKSFTAALEDRSRVLQLSASFHARAESFLANCPHWENAIRQVHGSTVPELNQALINLQEFWHEAQSAHEDVCADGRALANHLSSPVPSGSHTSLTAAVDYSQGRKHCTDLVHELWAWFKQLECVFSERRCCLTSRLARLMFKEDVGQVLAWLSEHGEPFLQRQISVGKSIQRAEQLYSAHMQFEQVAANTLTNAEKLISAADELAAQADDPEEILQEANQLQQRISAFTRTVEMRRETLDLGCGFYAHTKELLTWLHNHRETHNSGEHLPTTIEGMEDELTSFHRDRVALEKDVNRVLAEGEALQSRIKDNEEVTHLRSVLNQVTNERAAVSTLLTERQVRLDLCLQLRLFEADVHSALDCLRHNVPSLDQQNHHHHQQQQQQSDNSANSNRYFWLSDPRKAPDMSLLEEVSNSCLSVLPTAEEVLNKGSELARAFESVGVNFPAGGPGSSDSGVGDSVETAMERVHRLINELAEAVQIVDLLNEQISSELDWRRLQLQSRQVLHWIAQCEDILHQTAVVPASLAEAEASQADHEKFQPVLNDAHPQAVQCAARASYLLQQQQQTSTSEPNPRRQDYQNVAETVANRWQKLVYAAEERHKLLIAATNWYKTFDQVTSVLWSLEKEYRREEDWCQSEKALNGGTEPQQYLSELSTKHAEQKEAFLKACMLARRTSDLFSKYLHRQSPHTTGRVEVEEKIRVAMNELMNKEQAVLEAWAVRRRRLDDCIYFMNLKRQIEDLIERVRKAQGSRGGYYGSIVSGSGPTTSGLGSISQLNSSLLQEISRACASLESMIHSSSSLSPSHNVQMQRLLQYLRQSESSVFSGAGHPTAHTLATTENQKLACSATTPFPAQMQQEQTQTRTKRPDVDYDRTSVSSTTSSNAGSASATTLSSDSSSSSTTATGITTTASSAATASGPTQEQRRLQRKREHVLRELIQTERAYVQALKHCLDTYRTGLINPPKGLATQLPVELSNKVDIIFGNLLKIYEFHKTLFEPELGKYIESGDFQPEDVGHCFVVHSDSFANLYVQYCVNHVESTNVVIEHGQNYFQSLQMHHNLVEPIQSHLIKPVQRVTKYQLLLRELCDCCDPASVGEINEGLEAMLSVPKRANDALHLSMLQNLPDELSISTLGDVILQDQFTVWEPKQLIRKSRDRRIFLFDVCLLLAKEAPSQPNEHRAKYLYKSHLLLADCNITEHIEGDECKFALWTGRIPPIHEYRLVLRAATLELKQTWVRALREVMRERVFTVQSLYQNRQQNLHSSNLLFDESSTGADNLDTYYILENYQANGANEVSVSAHQIVQLLHRCEAPDLSAISTASICTLTESVEDNNPNPPDQISNTSKAKSNLTHETSSTGTGTSTAGEWALVRVIVTGSATSTNSPTKEGFIPSRLIGAPCSGGRKLSQSGPSGSGHVSGSKQHTSSGRRSSSGGTSVRKWLPTGVSSVRRSVGTNSTVSSILPGKRGSKPDGNQTQISSTIVPNVGQAPGAANRDTNDNNRPVRSPQDAMHNLDAILDNVSEESVDVELPPPMTEIQAVLNLRQNMTSENGASANVDSAQEAESIGPPKRASPTVNQKSTTDTGNTEDKLTPNPSNEINQQSLPRTMQKQANLPEVAGDCETELGNVPIVVGLPAGCSLSSLGDLRLHGGLSVATKLVATPTAATVNASSPSQSNKTNNNASAQQREQDEELLLSLMDDGVELHFVNRHFLLYDQALVIADAVVELHPIHQKAHNDTASRQISTASHDPPTGPTTQLRCRFRHALPIGQISILDDVGVAGSRPVGEQQLLWFCLSERTRSLGSPFDQSNLPSTPPQSHLCYIVAPKSTETRLRWLTQLTTMIAEARRLSQAFLLGGGHFDQNNSSFKLNNPAISLYPTGLLFDTNTLELPKLGRLNLPSTTNDKATSSTGVSQASKVLSQLTICTTNSIQTSTNHPLASIR